MRVEKESKRVLLYAEYVFYMNGILFFGCNNTHKILCSTIYTHCIKERT